MAIPSIQFYPGDWLRDNVAGCSLAAQGLWLRMMLVLHDCERRGYLALNGSAMPEAMVARRCGSTLDEYRTLLAELVAAGVPSFTADGILFSRRMVRDERERVVTRERVKKYRSKGEDKGETVTDLKRSCNASVTVEKRQCNTVSSSSSSSSKNPPNPPRGGGDVKTRKVRVSSCAETALKRAIADGLNAEIDERSKRGERLTVMLTQLGYYNGPLAT